MGEAKTRREMNEAEQKIYSAFNAKMKGALSDTSKNEAGLQVLRFILHESRFLAPLTHETAEGVNTEILLQNEAVRMLYLRLRTHMDNGTIIRVEMDATPKQEEKDDRA